MLESEALVAIRKLIMKKLTLSTVENSYLKRAFFSLILITISPFAFSQTYPSFGPEKQVIINGLTFDAMEPFISPDENYLFFNNLNDGVNTKLYYATKVNDSTFNFVGELNGANQTTPPHLDAVADLDSLNNFYWTSTREYPTEFDNLFHGKFNGENIFNIGRVHGDFYINAPGWLIMDHGISYDGQLLYFNNARFDGSNCMGPCETHIGVAKKENDSTFIKLSNSDEILQKVNDPKYIYYAPCITRDNLELYYTRYLKGSITTSTLFEVCVVVRNTSSDAFSSPHVLFSDVIANIIEAPTLTADNQIMYYHKKIGGVHKIMFRYRQTITDLLQPIENKATLTITPNPIINNAIVEFENKIRDPITLTLFDNLGRIVRTVNKISTNRIEINRDNLNAGLYIVQIQTEGKMIAIGRLIIE